MTGKRVILWMFCGMIATMTGCSHYYQVNDPAGARLYYTTDIDKIKAGAITFTDETRGSVITLQSSEVKEISEEEFDAAVKRSERKSK